MVICRLCQHENPDGTQFCGKCGNVLETGTEVLTPSSASSASNPSSSSAGNAPQGASSGSPIPGAIPQAVETPRSQPEPYVAVEGPHSQTYEPPNTIPFNHVDQKEYAERLANPDKPDYENVSVLAFIFGFVGFLFNPLYLVSLAAIVLGVIGHVNNGSKKSLAKIGWILGLIALITQVIISLLFAALTFGLIRFLFRF